MSKDKKYKNKRTKNFMYEDGGKNTKLDLYNKDKHRRENKIDTDLVDAIMENELREQELMYLDNWHDE
jgi:hypothetical protein